jgi:type II secretory pathway pseudopilin PulG
MRTPAQGRRKAGDEGITLLEIMIGMSLMSVVTVVVLGGISTIYTGTTRTEQLAVARDQLSNSFRRIEREIRYANWISTPGQVGNRWYAEYAMQNACRQLIFRDGVLSLATWPLTGGTPSMAGTIATGLSQTGTTAPFRAYLPGVQPFASASPGTGAMGKDFSPEFAQLRIRFTSTEGRVTLPFDVTFTAQNTSRNTPTANNCSQGRPTT